MASRLRELIVVGLVLAVLYVGPYSAVTARYARVSQNVQGGEWWRSHYFGDGFEEFETQGNDDGEHVWTGHVWAGLTLATSIDLTGQTGLALHFRKPSGTVQTITSNVSVSGSAGDGNVTYTVVTGDDLWDEDGVYDVTVGVDFSGEEHESQPPVEITIYRQNQER